MPRHQAGSEIYAFELCRALSASHDVTVVCADYDLSRRHGQVRWRVHEGLPVAEIVNNWVCASFEETYRPPLMSDRITHVLRAVQPDVIHVHNLLNLSFDLPAIAHAHGIPVVATLHDYTLVCPSGGQRVHRAEHHLCDVIDTERCARCFPQSSLYAQVSFGRLAAATRAPGPIGRAALATARRLPRLEGLFGRAARRMAILPLSRRDIEARLAAARRAFDEVDLFVAPSPSLAVEFRKLGLDPSKIRISDYGFVPLVGGLRPTGGSGGADQKRVLRIGYVGTLVWHKGVHVLIDAIRHLPPTTYELKIFGDPNVFPEYASYLQARAAGFPVRFMGSFDRDRTADVYAELDVLVVPSLWLENSPLVIHEAFMAGVPVVAARIGGIADLVEDGRTGLLYDPTSPSELESRLRSLIENPARADELARNAPRVKAITEDAREWEDTYGDVLKRRGTVLKS